jgi:type I protein arginine methyltransferase
MTEELKAQEPVPEAGGIHTNDAGSVQQYFKFYSKLQN